MSMYHDDDLAAHVEDELRSERRICRTCYRPIELSADIEHYENTGMLCDACLAEKLGIVPGGRGQA